MATTDLTATQIAFLTAVGKEPELTRQFYWTGGTVLAAEYLHHRISDDIDLFTEAGLVDLEAITVFLRRVKSNLGYDEFDIQTTFNRNLVFLRLSNGAVLKTEFTSYPFPRLETATQQRFGVNLDSPKDIAVNKLFTINQKPRGRDYVDLFFLVETYRYQLHDLMALARIKFDWHIDPIQLGSRLVSPDLSDWPTLVRPLTQVKLKAFLREQARQLQDDVFTISDTDQGRG
ncbi:nucleotidyl transferase AbiEii/AbiGii toxin family protein [Candidatus Berkelbacteria bacterium]|nr:nucleotidyl transferase AbiEii/AbiGii toxin family protein [Candidatus Berkelbacteria bacterium]